VSQLGECQVGYQGGSRCYGKVHRAKAAFGLRILERVKEKSFPPRTVVGAVRVKERGKKRTTGETS